MIAVDSNILVYAHRRDAKFHEPAVQVMKELAEGEATWALPWPCLHELYAIVTHRRIFDPPSTAAQARRQIDAWLASPSVELLSEGDEHWPQLAQLLEEGKVEGPMVHDARVAAICLAHGVRELLTADRDFSRFPRLATRNPLV